MHNIRVQLHDNSTVSKLVVGVSGCVDISIERIHWICVLRICTLDLDRIILQVIHIVPRQANRSNIP